MALTYNRVQQVAAAAARLANDATEMLARIEQFLEYNSDQAIDWADKKIKEIYDTLGA